MKRTILGSAATGLTLISMGATAPSFAQEAQTSQPLELLSCADTPAPCLTAEGQVALEDGTVVDLDAAVDAIAAGSETTTASGGMPAGEMADEDTLEDALAEELAGDAGLEVEGEAEADVSSETEAMQATDAATDEPATDAGTVEKSVEETVAETVENETVAEEIMADEPAAGEATADAMTEEDLAEQAQAEAMAEAEAAATAQSAAAAGEAEAEGEVQTETITEDAARSSDEEFATTEQATGDDGGLSNLEKFLIGAVGAAVVGNVLSDNDEVVSNTGDRVVIERDGQLRVLKNDDALLRQPGAQVATETFSDGSTRSTLTRPGGAKVITIRAADGRVLRRERVLDDGTTYVLFDDTQEIDTVDVAALPDAPQKTVTYEQSEEDALRDALAASQANSRDIGRSFSLNQIRNIRAVRELAPEIELTNVNFRTGSAAITPSEAEELAALGRAMRDAIEENPREVFLVEGHTDAVGRASYNLALSDRRAESLALALSEYFEVPPENMIVQGYGERYLKVPTVTAERDNRRAAVRIITPLLARSVAAAQ